MKDKSKHKQTKMKSTAPLGTGLLQSAVKKTQSAGQKRCVAAGGRWVNSACSFR